MLSIANWESSESNRNLKESTRRAKLKLWQHARRLHRWRAWLEENRAHLKSETGALSQFTACRFLLRGRSQPLYVISPQPGTASQARWPGVHGVLERARHSSGSGRSQDGVRWRSLRYGRARLPPDRADRYEALSASSAGRAGMQRAPTRACPR